MIPKQEQVQVFSNSTNEKEFTINASVEAFRILSSGLYSNKIQAIIRELSCNAYDAHVMAGTPDRPFVIHLPDSWEPFFSIEDFGIGLDDEDVDNIYTSYFTSTKTSSNDLIGGLGLGSKTPFSYTDTFTIRTRKDGVERIYNAYVGKTGSPTVSMMSELDTDEPNGVKVTVPVRNEDFYNFRQEAYKVFQWFKILPTVNGLQLDNDNVKRLEEANGLLVDTSSHQKQRITVVMGNVAYSVVPDEKNLPKSNQKAWMFLQNAHLTIRFNIGDLSVTASRESISFDDETIKTFVNRIENFAKDFYDEIQERVNSECANKKEAIIYTENELGAFGLNILEFDGENLNKLAEEDVTESISAFLDDENNQVDSVFEYWNVSGSGNVRKSAYTPGDYISKWKFSSAMRCRVAFIQDDSLHHRGLDRAARQFLRDNRLNRVYTVNCVLSQVEKDRIIKAFGKEQVEFLGFEAVRESQKEVRQKEIKERGPRKTPVARAKKNEIRVDIWQNNKVFHPDVADHYKKNFTVGRELVDIDELSTKRVGLFISNRGENEVGVLGYGMTMTRKNLLALCKLFELDYIVVSRLSEVEKIKAKMPFLINVSDLTHKDIRNNEMFFFLHMKYMGIVGRIQNKHTNVREQFYINSQFFKNGNYSNVKEKKVVLKMDMFKIADEFQYENVGFENLIRKCDEVLNGLSEIERFWLMHNDGLGIGMQYCETKIREMIYSEINRDAQAYYQVRRNALDQYPLVKYFIDDMEQYEDEEEEEYKLKDEIQNYINQIDRLRVLEKLAEKELYNLAA